MGEGVVSSNIQYANDNIVIVDKLLQVFIPPHLITGTVVPPADVLCLPVVSAEAHARDPKVFRLAVWTFLSTEGGVLKQCLGTLLGFVRAKS